MKMSASRSAGYLNDGPAFNGYATPKTMIYSQFSYIQPTTRLTLDYGAIPEDFPPGGIATGVYVPTSPVLTWTVQFTGLGAGESAGLTSLLGRARRHDLRRLLAAQRRCRQSQLVLLEDATGPPDYHRPGVDGSANA